jgi:hypothetical protein
MLFSIFPLASIRLSAKCPHILPVTVSQIVAELASIEPRTVLPLETALSVHLAIEPMPAVDFSIWPTIDPDSTYLVFNELSLVHAPVGNFKNALAFFQTVLILTFILRPVRPFFNAITMLLVVLPFSLVAGPVRLDASALPVHLVFEPGSFQSSAV